MLGCGWPNDEEENHGNPANWTLVILKLKMLAIFHYRSINNILKKKIF